MNKYSLSALVAAGLLAGGLVTSANAADLGGNCCADLEERIAELEATTARKGNRKVSLTVSGWVGQQISFWDDGVESNSYVHDLGSTLGSHVKFTGSAQISSGWSAGYVLHIEAISSDGLTTSQNNPVGVAALVGTTSGVQTLQSYWFVKSDQLGKISLGKQSQASDNTAILVDGSGSLVPANWVAFDVNSFNVRLSNGSRLAQTAGGAAPGFLTWGGGQSCFGQGGAWGDCNGLTQNVVRYDSPTFGGFSVSASWGSDDMWDVAARYAGEHHGFKIAAAVAYNEVNDQSYNGGTGVPDMDYFQAGVYLQHVATGLFVLGNYGSLDVDYVRQDETNDPETWYVKAGLRTKWNHLGASVFYGEYLNGQDGVAGGQYNSPDGGFDGNSKISDSDLQVWGLGFVQEIDAAAMSVWVKYRHLSLDVETNNGKIEDVGIEDFQYVGVGGLINF